MSDQVLDSELYEIDQFLKAESSNQNQAASKYSRPCFSKIFNGPYHRYQHDNRITDIREVDETEHDPQTGIPSPSLSDLSTSFSDFDCSEDESDVSMSSLISASLTAKSCSRVSSASAKQEFGDDSGIDQDSDSADQDSDEQPDSRCD